MNSAVEGTEVGGLTSEYLSVRRLANGNFSERIGFVVWASTFISHLVELGLTPVQPKSSANRPAFPAFGFRIFKCERGASKLAPLVVSYRGRRQAAGAGMSCLWLLLLAPELPRPAIVPTASASIIRGVTLVTFPVALLERVTEKLLVLSPVYTGRVIAFSRVSPVT